MFRSIIAILMMAFSLFGYAKVSAVQTKAIYKKISQVAGFTPPPLLITDCGQVNAYTQVQKITICTEIMDVLNVDQMAVIIGHELAHFKHQDWSGWQNSKSREYRCDYWGIQWAKKAKYNACKGAGFAMVFYNMWGDGDKFFGSHPGNLKRYKAMLRVCGE